MSYGELKIDTITFTAGGVDTSVSVSGLVQNPTFTGNITTTGTISGDVIEGNTVSGATVTGDTGDFGNLTAVSGVFTTQVSGATVTGDSGEFTTLTGNTARFTNISGQTATYVVPGDDEGITITGASADINGALTFDSNQSAASNFLGQIFFNWNGTTVGKITGATGADTVNKDDGSIGFWTSSAGTPAKSFDIESNGNVVFANSKRIEVDEVRARDSDGLELYDDNGAGIHVHDGGTTEITVSGTAAAPALYFNGDSDTGIYSPGADQVAISTSGTGRLFVDSSGRLLAGTSSTSVTCSALFQGRSDGATNSAVIQLAKGSSTPGATDSLGIIKFADSGAQAAAQIQASRDGGTWTSGSRTPGALLFFTAPDSASAAQERLRITSDGKLGLGTTSPDSNTKLHVSASENSSDPFATDASVTISNYQNAGSNEAASLKFLLGAAPGTNAGSISCHYDSFSSGVNSSLRFYTVFQSGFNSAAERMRIDPQGRVGIGTTSPGQLLDVNGVAKIQNSTHGRYFEFVTDSLNSYLDVSHGLQIRTNGGSSLTNAVFIDSSQRVGIGTTSPTFTSGSGLEIARQGTATLRIEDETNSKALEIYVDSTGTTIDSRGAGARTNFAIAGNSKMLLDNSGRVLVGTSTALSAGEPANALFQVLGRNGGATEESRFALARGEAASSISNNEPIGTIYFTDNAGSTFADIRCAADAAAGSSDYPGRLVFSTTADTASGPTERMRITKDGEIYINRTTQDTLVGAGCKFQLDCTGSEWAAIIRNSNALPYGLRIAHTTDINNTSNLFLQCVGTTIQRASIRANGGLANFQSNNVDLSDERTKRDISSVSSTWDCVQAWDVVNYNYLEDAADDTARIGVIAQQVQQHCPEVVIPYQEAEDAVLDDDGNVVTPAKEERLGVREQQMMWMAIKALQEAQTRIETLEAEVAALKGA